MPLITHSHRVAKVGTQAHSHVHANTNFIKYLGCQLPPPQSCMSPLKRGTDFRGADSTDSKPYIARRQRIEASRQQPLYVRNLALQLCTIQIVRSIACTSATHCSTETHVVCTVASMHALAKPCKTPYPSCHASSPSVSILERDHSC
jgi:hypothetical protein